MPDLSSYNLTNAFEKIEAELIDGVYIPNTNNADEYVRLQQLYNFRSKLAKEGLNTDWIAKTTSSRYWSASFYFCRVRVRDFTYARKFII